MYMSALNYKCLSTPASVSDTKKLKNPCCSQAPHLSSASVRHHHGEGGQLHSATAWNTQFPQSNGLCRHCTLPAIARGWWRAKELVSVFESAQQRKGFNWIRIKKRMKSDYTSWSNTLAVSFSPKCSLYSGLCFRLVKTNAWKKWRAPLCSDAERGLQLVASMVASAGETDRDLAAPQFRRNYGAYNIIEF